MVYLSLISLQVVRSTGMQIEKKDLAVSFLQTFKVRYRKRTIMSRGSFKSAVFPAFFSID